MVRAATAVVAFRADASIQGPGFEFVWDAGPFCEPFALKTDPSGSITDGAPPGFAYRRYTSCEWQLRPPAGPLTLRLLRAGLGEGARLSVSDATGVPLRVLTGTWADLGGGGGGRRWRGYRWWVRGYPWWGYGIKWR